ncbi:MAG TPA: DUF58 domain-containing protein [Treponemataceae bacterium]|nr:DUF58 domain-containing protein [Treponemataceae bacterium]
MRRRPAYWAIPLLVVFLFLPGRAPQFIIAFTLCIGVFSQVYSRVLESKLTASRVVDFLKISNRDSIVLTIVVENHSFLPVHALSVIDSGKGASSTWEIGRWLIGLAPREKKALKYIVTARTRGEFSVGPIQLTSSDPLGLFPFTITVTSLCRILVRPARKEVRLSIKNGIPQGELTVFNPRYEDISVYRSVRDYTSGDEIKRINWKSSARFGRLFTNEYQDTLNCPFFIFLDLSRESYPLQLRHSMAEAAIEVAAALVNVTTRAHQRCGFASTGSIGHSEVQPYLQVGSRQAEIILDMLAKINLSSGRCADTHLLVRALYTTPHGSRFFRIGPTPNSAEEPKGIRYRSISEYIHEASLNA